MSRTTKMLVIALVISATVNVFFLGFAAARLARRGHFGGHGPAAHDADTGQLGPLRDQWRARMAALGSQRQAIGEARAAVRQALTAEPYNGESLRVALEALRARTSDTQASLDRTLVEFAGTLNAEERRQLAESRFFAGPGPFGGGFGRGAPRQR